MRGMISLLPKISNIYNVLLLFKGFQYVIPHIVIKGVVLVYVLFRVLSRVNHVIIYALTSALN